MSGSLCANWRSETKVTAGNGLCDHESCFFGDEQLVASAGSE